jgi:hypothetical protein
LLLVKTPTAALWTQIMTTCYIDHTDFKVDDNSPIRDTIVLGGILISHLEEVKLSQLIKLVKSRYAHSDLPIKYNFKDLRKKYEEHDHLDGFAKMLEDSFHWRKELFSKSLDIDYQIIIAVIKNLQVSKKDQKDIKSSLLSYAFCNTLMRVALECQKKKISPVRIVLDWPESNNPKPFNNSYYYAYSRGLTPDGQKYFSGRLSELNFADSVSFASMNHSNMLQFTDLIIGAAKDFLSTHLNSREYSIGKELTELILKKFRGYPRILNYGISISSNNPDLKERIAMLMDKYNPNH